MIAAYGGNAVATGGQRYPLGLQAAPQIPLIADGHSASYAQVDKFPETANNACSVMGRGRNDVGGAARSAAVPSFPAERPPDKDKVGTVLQRLFANHIGDGAHPHANTDVDVRGFLQFLDVPPCIFTKCLLELMVQRLLRPCINAGDRVDEP